MLPVFIYLAYLITPDSMFKSMNENPQFSDIKPQPNNCRMIEDTKSLIPNNKYTCS